MYPASEKRFLNISLITIITLFVLILAGGVVRSSGSGMGCPDWPKCFDKYIPPTNASELPANYREKYVEKRVAKNQRFAHMLDVLGYGKMAERIRNDESILKAEEFNALNTWIEYINRLVGVVFGFLLIACFIYSFTYFRLSKSIFFLSLLNLFLVGFQGWLGSIVVSTNLMPWLITLHMLLAIAILAICIATYFKARILRDRHLLTSTPTKYVKIWAMVAMLLTVVQILLGTTVREQVDALAVAMNNLNRSEWVSNLGITFDIHRDLAILVLIVNIVLFVMVRARYVMKGHQFKYVLAVLILIGLQILSGIILSYLALPPVAQTTHLVLACILFGAQYYLMLLLGRNKLYSRI
ncbi:MAG TPA: COX15/CtaA family protein [Daejeonella sp.]|nr:COX15/CtaA family protein [Daejeonella sp.]